MRGIAWLSAISCGPPCLQGLPFMTMMASGDDRLPIACPVYREPPAVVGHLIPRRPPVVTGFLMCAIGRHGGPPCLQGFPFMFIMASGGDRLPLAFLCSASLPLWSGISFHEGIRSWPASCCSSFLFMRLSFYLQRSDLFSSIVVAEMVVHARGPCAELGRPALAAVIYLTVYAYLYTHIKRPFPPPFPESVSGVFSP